MSKSALPAQDSASEERAAEIETKKPPSLLLATLRKIAHFASAQLLLIAFGLACLLAYYFPREY